LLKLVSCIIVDVRYGALRVRTGRPARKTVPRRAGQRAELARTRQSSDEDGTSTYDEGS
jgi:hypothetical protein